MMDREKIAKIIRALLDKTTENGATEAEAMSSATKARELMDRYNVDRGSVGMEEEGVYKAFSKRTNYKTLMLKDRMAAAIARFCDCKVWLNKGKDGGVITFFGLKSDADFAVWLLDSLDGFIRAQALPWIATHKAVVYKQRWEMEKAFVFGAADRISERLSQLTRERAAAMAEAARTSTGTSLVVVKMAIVTREFAKLHMRLGRSSGSSARVNDGGAYSSGRAAGDRASFGRPVNGPGSSVKLIR